MSTNNYNDLIRDAKLLKKLLLNENVKLSLNMCQEIMAKLYKYSSLHEAQQVLSQSNYIIQKPIYNVQLEDILTYLNKSNPDNMWNGRASVIIKGLCKSLFKDLTEINIEDFIKYTDLNELIKFNTPEYPDIKRGFATYPIFTYKDKDGKIPPIITNLVEQMFKPYIHIIKKDILLQGRPGTGKTTWTEILIRNWMCTHPGKKVIILDICNGWSDYINYYKFTETNLKIDSIETNDFKLNSNILSLVSTQLKSTDMLHINISDYPNISTIYEHWYNQLIKLNIDDDVLIVFDELHRAHNIKSLSKEPFSLTTFIYVTQSDIELKYDVETLVPFNIIPTSGNQWISSRNRLIQYFKQQVILKYGYAKALQLLNTAYPYGITERLPPNAPLATLEPYMLKIEELA